MRWYCELNLFTKIFLAVGVGFLLYGLFSRLVPIYFFWEALVLGWFVTLIGVIGMLFEKVRTKKEVNKSTVFYKVGIGIIVFVLIGQIAMWVFFTKTEAYNESVTYILNDVDFESELGEIQDVFLIPMGSIEINSSSKGDVGSASLTFTIKGAKAYKDLMIYTYTDLEHDDWVVYRHIHN